MRGRGSAWATRWVRGCRRGMWAQRGVLLVVDAGGSPPAAGADRVAAGEEVVLFLAVLGFLQDLSRAVGDEGPRLVRVEPIGHRLDVAVDVVGGGGVSRLEQGRGAVDHALLVAVELGVVVAIVVRVGRPRSDGDLVAGDVARSVVAGVLRRLRGRGRAAGVDVLREQLSVGVVAVGAPLGDRAGT